MILADFSCGFSRLPERNTSVSILICIRCENEGDLMMPGGKRCGDFKTPFDLEALTRLTSYL